MIFEVPIPDLRNTKPETLCPKPKHLKLYTNSLEYNINILNIASDLTTSS